MSMQEWDKYTAPVLRSIEKDAKWLSHYGDSITRTVALLPAKPDFPTKAEDELAKAEANLLTALNRVRQAMTIYESKSAQQLQAAE